MCQPLSGTGGSADKVVNAATVEIRFKAVVLIENWCSIKPTIKIGTVGLVSWSHFSTKGYTISLFVIVAIE